MVKLDKWPLVVKDAFAWTDTFAIILEYLIYKKEQQNASLSFQLNTPAKLTKH